MQKVAVVTGANRGLGYETSRQLAKQDIQVILTSRDRAKGEAAVEKLQTEGLNIIYHHLDVVNPESINSLTQFIRNQFGHLEILVNNAAIGINALEIANPQTSTFDLKIDTLQKTLETNLYGPLLLCQALIPLMKENNYGRVVNVSSRAGQLSGMNELRGIFPEYRISKTALNTLTRMLAYELKETNILVNSVCPGWTKTELGGSKAPRTVEQGTETIVWLATLPDDGPRSGFFRDRQLIDW